MQDLGYELPRIPIPRTPVNKGKRKGRELLHSPALFLQAISSYLDVCALGMALAMVLVLDLAATAALAGLCGARTLTKGSGLRCERSSRSAKGHAKRQHKCCDQQRYALLHLLTSSPFSPKRKPAYLSLGEIAGCATGSTRPS